MADPSELPTYLSGTTRGAQQEYRAAQTDTSSMGNFRANNMDASNMQTRNMPASLSNMQGTSNIPGSGGMPHNEPQYVWASDGTKVRNPMLRAMNPGEEKDQFKSDEVE